MWLAEGGDGEVSVVLVARGGEWSWSAGMMRAACAALTVPRRVLKSAARVGRRSAMMCGGDGGNVCAQKDIFWSWVK